MTWLRTALKRGSWLIALRSRGAAMSTVTEGPSVAPGPAERNDAVGEQDAFVDVVGDQHDGLLVLLPDALDLVLQRGARQRVERAERFVEQQHLRVHRQRARHRDALPHAAGKLARRLSRAGVRFTIAMYFSAWRALLCRRPVREDLVDRQVDIFVHRQPRQQRVVLEHDAAVGAGPGDCGLPSSVIVPLSGAISPAISEISVVLPAPE